MSRKKNPILRHRFNQKNKDIFTEINTSIDFDKFMFNEDIEGSIAHAEMLSKQKIITVLEKNKIISGLKKILLEIKNNKFIFNPELEDIHMNIENRLQELVGDVAGKLHTARSRNDQVVTDLKLWLRKDIDLILTELKVLKKIIIKNAEKNINIIMPGFTHLQTAQPISAGHYYMSYYEMFMRDTDRFIESRERLNKNPLGSCAMAGTSFKIDRFETSKKLSFNGPTNNSIDSVADRDFVIDYLYASSTCAMHLSRIAEEIVLWSSNLVKFCEIKDEMMSSSSIMPQKKNPDAAELVRAKASLINGNLLSLLNIMKALPLSYSKDLQEDKKLVVDTSKNLHVSIKVITEILKGIRLNKENMLKAALDGYSNATELADWLVKNLGYSFRKAHQISAKIVNFAEINKLRLEDLSLEELKKFDSNINNNIFKSLNIKNAVLSKTSYGGTSPSEVIKMIKKAKKINK
ncbi:argininosuccinate lyase [Pelagibacterales bacterium]|nr:argininosuccinate lyase [Pelagibacterales bacterium]